LPHSHIINIQSGEQHKNIQTCGHIWTQLTAANADRRAALINLGGGVISDMGGFAAACYKRGIAHINIPTTLLAMVDASVGGKTGIDFAHFKNQVGLFCDAVAVLVCNEFLQTLDERQLRSGMAEMIKHYLIADERAFIDFSQADGSVYLHPTIEMIKKSVEIKSAIVAEDPLEKNIRKKLNFGHTIGHALESCTIQSAAPLLHGEAVAFGMAIETFISAFKGLMSEEKAEFVCYILYVTFGLQPLPEAMIDTILRFAMQDKKNDNGVIKMSLIDAIGSCQVDIAVSADEIKQAIAYFNKSISWHDR
jgi:3-dehydroquinate synthase